MPKKVRSAKGEIVDFDLMKVKQQIEAAPEPTNVQGRQDFIDQKMRRRLKKVKRKLDTVPKRQVDANGNPVEVDKKVAAKTTPQGEKIDVVKDKPKTAPKKTSKTKRKIKKKAKKKVD